MCSFAWFDYQAAFFTYMSALIPGVIFAQTSYIEILIVTTKVTRRRMDVHCGGLPQPTFSFPARGCSLESSRSTFNTRSRIS